MSQQEYDREILELLIEVDEKATGLDSSQIEFVARLIDRDVTTFSIEQANRIKALHRNHVRDEDDSVDLDREELEDEEF